MKAVALDRSRYSADLLKRVAGGWRRLAARERKNAFQAARITAELTALGAPPSILALAAHVVQEKIRHIEVCGRVLELLGARVPRAARAIELAVGQPRASAITETGLARTLVADFALGKPVAAAALAAARAVVREPLFAWAYTELLQDEARHATFGAQAASWVVRHWSARQRETLWATCLAANATESLQLPNDPEAEALGFLPAQADDTLPRWILPHLAPLGMSMSGSRSPSPSNDRPLLH